MIAPYDHRTEGTRNRLDGGRNCHYTNKYYHTAEGNFYYYINSKGFYHAVKPCRMKVNGVFSHYAISDYLITKDNKIKEISCNGFFKTREDCIAAIEKNLAPDA